MRKRQLSPWMVVLALGAACSSGKGSSMRPGSGGVSPGSPPGSLLSCGVGADVGGKLAAGDGSTLAPDARYTLTLTGSGDNPSYLPAIADAQEPAEPLTPALTVMAPNGQCPHLMTRVSPAVAIPHGSPIRALEGYWNGTRLPLDPVHGGPDSELLEEAHNFGPQQMPFNTPLYSLAGVPAGNGTLELRAYDANHKQVAVYTIPKLEVVTPPAAVPTSAIAGRAHPRFLLTADRLAHAQAKLAANDAQATRYTSARDRFLKALAQNPDPTSSGFADAIYNPSAYIPLLGVCYQLEKDSDPATATTCAGAARALALAIANAYDGPDAASKFARDTGYDIRDGEPMMLLALDWIYDTLSAADRQLLVKVATAWVDWYTSNDGAYSKSRPINNYFSPYLQALMLTGIVTAGDNDAADRELATLREKLTRIEPVANQRACGGDWPEGGNYGPNALRAHMMVYLGMLDLGEDWSQAFDFVQPLGLTLRYAITNDYTQMVPFGGFSGLLPHKTSPALLAMLTSATAAGDHAATLYQLAQAAKNDFGDPSDGDTVYELLLGDLGKHADSAGLPLACLSPGSGRFFSKSSLDDADGYLVTAEDMHYIFDHFGYANGDLRFYHGSTCILCASTYRGGAFDGEGVTPSFSTYQANDKVQAIDRNNQVFLTRDEPGFAAIGMRFESSFVSDRFDESIWDPGDPLDYLIREAVHVRPDVLVVRDLHRRRHAADSLVARFHLGPTAAPTSASATQWQVGNVTVSLAASLQPAVSFVDDKDQSGALVGQQLLQTFPSSTAPVEVVDVFSDSGVTLVGYAGGVAKLSNGKCVTFANGDVSVGSCG